MRTPLSVGIWVPLLAAVTLAVPVQDVAPTALEAFATKPSAMVVWASPIGRLESTAALALVTAVAVQDRETWSTLRGLRIDLVHLRPNPECDWRFRVQAVFCARANAAIYLEEDILTRVRDGVARGNADQNLVMSYWQSSQSERTSGLIIGGYVFAGRQPGELVALIERGISELKNAAR